jgi:hypothetical protein
VANPHEVFAITANFILFVETGGNGNDNDADRIKANAADLQHSSISKGETAYLMSEQVTNFA